MEQKKDIRKRILKKRSQLSEKLWEEYSVSIATLLINHPIFEEAEIVYGYMPIRNEVDTLPILEEAFRLHKKVALPKVLSKTEMQFFEVESFQELTPGAYGILEPQTEHPAMAEEGLMLMPGACFDRELHRIGYGGGYYDRFLEAHPHFTTAALAFTLQCLEQIPWDPHDIRPEYLFTEQEIRSRT